MDEKDIYQYRNEIIDLHLILEDTIHTLIQSAFRVNVRPSFSKNYSKLDLLIDIGIIDKKYSKDFNLFSEVRNCFAHTLGLYKPSQLPEILKKKLVDRYRLEKSHLNDDDELFEAIKSLHQSLVEGSLPRIFKAINHGHSATQLLENTKIELERLVNYILNKYPNETKDHLMSFFSFPNFKPLK